VSLIHHINQALKAHVSMHRDTDYVVEEAEVVIVDQFTGRLMKGRRYSDGLHQDRKSTRLNSSHVSISYAVFCLKKKKKIEQRDRIINSVRWHKKETDANTSCMTVKSDRSM